jgi:hypothetical protein
LVLAACNASTDHEVKTIPSPPTTRVSLDWDMRVEGDQLRIDYTIHNRTGSRVTVVDGLRDHGTFTSDAIVVQAGEAPDLIAFTRAFVPANPDFKPERPPMPRYVEIAAGAEAKGVAHTRLPLGAAHNFSGTYAITGRRTTAVLEVGYFDDPAIDPASAPKSSASKLLRGAVKPLPTGVTLAPPADQVARSFGNVKMPR